MHLKRNEHTMGSLIHFKTTFNCTQPWQQIHFWIPRHNVDTILTCAFKIMLPWWRHSSTCVMTSELNDTISGMISLRNWAVKNEISRLVIIILRTRSEIPLLSNGGRRIVFVRLSEVPRKSANRNFYSGLLAVARVISEVEHLTSKTKNPTLTVNGF